MIAESTCGLNFKTQQLLNSIFLKYPQIDEIILYGSRAKGNFKVGSDIDLTIKSSSMNLSDLLKIEDDIDNLLLPYKVDLSLMHLIDNDELIKHIERVGIQIYKK